MNLILKKLLVKMNTCRQRAILTIDASDILLPRLLDSLVAFGLSRNNTKVDELLCQLKHELELESLEKWSKQVAFGDFFCKKQ